MKIVQEGSRVNNLTCEIGIVTEYQVDSSSTTGNLASTGTLVEVKVHLQGEASEKDTHQWSGIGQNEALTKHKGSNWNDKSRKANLDAVGLMEITIGPVAAETAWLRSRSTDEARFSRTGGLEDLGWCDSS
jgi:hypothetical protein